MPRKPKFRPRINKIKLNPEQAVLVCDCYCEPWGAKGPDHGVGNTHGCVVVGDPWV